MKHCLQVLLTHSTSPIIRQMFSLVTLCLIAVGCGSDSPSSPSQEIQNLAFVRGNRIFISDRTPSDERAVTEEGVYPFLLWSPDGSQIAYTASVGPNPFNPLEKLTVLGRDGAGRRSLAIGSIDPDGIRWSTDSKSLLVQGVIDTVGGVGGDWAIDIATGVATQTVLPGTTWNDAWEIEGRVIETYPSPDGSQQAILSQVGTEIQLHVGDSALGTVTRVTDRSVPSLPPVWSLDGTRIAFVDDGQIFTVGADGTGLTQHTQESHNYRVISWSPNGEVIAFSGNLRELVTNFGPQ